MKSTHAAIAAALLAALACPQSSAWAQSFSEPATIFYGKVVGTGSAQPFLVTEGALQWTILRHDGSSITLNTTLFPLGDGEYSYRLDVPHAAFSLGLSSTSGGVPMPPTPQTHLHQRIEVDGELAEILGPAGSSFTTEQLLRTATHRMDLALGRAALDTDGDGLPDYWEDLYGLDKQDPSDASADLSGDGISALQAYLKGLDPRRDARAPALLTGELVVYRQASTGILLDTSDLNSNPDQLAYTLTALPQAGALVRRNAQADPNDPDAPLGVGSAFTHADLLAGRVVFQHDGSDADPGAFSVEVRDEDPAHPADAGDVRLLVYAMPEALPSSMSVGEAQRLDNALLGGVGYVVLDGGTMTTPRSFGAPSARLDDSALASYLASYGPDRPHALVGAGGGDALAGGAASDVLTPGPGNSSLAGGGGADLFVFRYFQNGRVVVEDFSKAQSDRLDLSRLPAAPEAYLHNYLRLVESAGVYELQTDLDGNGTGFTNLTVALPGLSAADADLYSLIAGGHLLVGGLRLEPRITVVASQPQASENGPTAGRFTLHRAGSLDGDLQVNIALSGTAQNGTDYVFVPGTVTLPSGVASVDVDITPYADGVSELAETVQLLVTSGTGYRVGTPGAATVTIEDLLMLVEIEALEPLASKLDGQPGYFLITRRDVVNRDVIVRLTIGGTALNGTDYTAISTFVQMGVNQTTALIQVAPKPTAILSGGMETVKLTLKADAAYRVVGAGQAEVSIVERIDSFASWAERSFPGTSANLAEFAQADSGATGVSHMQRYAFGLDPVNPDKAALPRAELVNGQFLLSFRKPHGLTDVQYRVRATVDLNDWTASGASVEQVPAPAGATDPQRVYYRIIPAAGASASGFIAVEVEWAP